MSSPRIPFLEAAKQSLAAMYPARQVKRGLQDPAVAGDTALRLGLFSLVSEGTRDWADYRGREGEFGTLDWAIVGHILIAEGGTTAELEDAEAELEGELLAWCQAQKPAPLDSVYPVRVAYSKGLDFPYGWIVMQLEALYV